MAQQTLFIDLPDADATCRFAQALAPLLRGGDTILLSGGIGAGKTHFARCFIQASLATPEDIPSPTYTLVQTYPGLQAEIWHADLYRLGDPDEVIELGLVDAMEQDICLIEWPDRLADLAPENALHLEFTLTNDGASRRLALTFSDAGWHDRVKKASDD